MINDNENEAGDQKQITNNNINRPRPRQDSNIQNKMFLKIRST